MALKPIACLSFFEQVSKNDHFLPKLFPLRASRRGPLRPGGLEVRRIRQLEVWILVRTGLVNLKVLGKRSGREETRRKAKRREGEGRGGTGREGRTGCLF